MKEGSAGRGRSGGGKLRERDWGLEVGWVEHGMSERHPVDIMRVVNFYPV